MVYSSGFLELTNYGIVCSIQQCYQKPTIVPPTPIVLFLGSNMIANNKEVQTMKKFIAFTTSTVLLSLFGATGLNLNTVYAASTQSNTTVNCSIHSCATTNCANTKNCKTSGQPLVYKNINLSNCKNADEVVKTLKANGLANITTKNVKNIKALKTILSKVENSALCKSNGCNGTKVKKTTVNTTKVTKAVAPEKATTATTPKKTTPAPKTTPTPTTSNTTTTTNTNVSSYANQVLQLVNQERAKAGLSALTTNTTLTSAANHRAQETVQSFSHTRPNGTTFSTVFKEFSVSYTAAGENIAYGQKTPQEVVTGWMNSPGHRANIMNGNFGKIGIGVHKPSNGTIYWTQLFTN